MNINQKTAIAGLLAMFGMRRTTAPTLPGKHHKQDIQQDKGRSEVAHLSKKERKKRKRQRRGRKH